jgi:RNA polymerase sigma-70 factor (ECF subfamily)
MRDEGELIRAAAGGDRPAFEELVRLKRDHVVRIAYQVTGDWDDAVDVAQGVFLRLWRGLDRFDRERRFDTWLHRVTTNAAIDLLRSRRTRRSVELPVEAAEELPERSAAPPEAALDLGRLRLAFRRLAARLAPRQRAVFVLHDVEGVSAAEVARMLDVAESTVRNHLLQARRVLRAGLEREYPDLVPGAPKARSSDEEGGA